MLDLTKFYNPSSLAVIGASNNPQKIGNAIVKNIITSGYRGKIYPVNPNEKKIEGLPCYPSVKDISSPVDLAIIAVPARLAPAVTRECGESGVKYLVVVTAGFKEVGYEGLQLEKELIDNCRRYDMHMLGPNCVGMMNTYTPLNASFSASYPPKGEIAFISQSGAMLVAILDWSRATGLGFSKVISLGNKGDLNEAHFIEEIANDDCTRVILCYIEDVTDGDYFLEVVSEATRKKPVIILKSGTSQAGARAASSHTGALAGSDLAYETAFRQCGVIRARTMAELFDLAVSFANQPMPSGNQVAVITNAGGPGILATDAIEARDLKMARFDKKTLDELRRQLPLESSIYNPVDVLGDASPERYRVALENVLQDEAVNSVLILVCPTAVTNASSISDVIIRAHEQHPQKPIFAAYMGGELLADGAKKLVKAGIPCYTFPEPAITAISGMTRYSQIHNRPHQHREKARHIADKERVKEIIEKVREDGRLVLLGSEAAEVATVYGIPVAPVKLATSPEEASSIADKMGYPVAMKVASPKILHKTDVGGVKLNISSAREARESYIEIIESVQRHLPEVMVHGVEVQKMMPKGIELIIGMTRDIQFGPLIAFGLGGIYVNLLKDVSFRLAKGLTRAEIGKMLAETKAYTLLRGYRGEKPADLKAVVDIIENVALLVTDFPSISELDINPVFAYSKGACALDIKITIS